MVNSLKFYSSILLIIFINQFSFSADAKPVTSGGIGYSKAKSLGKVDLLKFDSSFSAESGSGSRTNYVNLEMDILRIFGKVTENPTGNIIYGAQGGIEHYTIKSKSSLQGRCFIGPTAEVFFGLKDISFHTGLTYCDSRYGMSEVYILDTSLPRLNPYENSIHKFYYGGSFNISGDRGGGVRFRYDHIELDLNLRSTANTPQKVLFYSIGIELFTKI